MPLASMVVTSNSGDTDILVLIVAQHIAVFCLVSACGLVLGLSLIGLGGVDLCQVRVA